MAAQPRSEQRALSWLAWFGTCAVASAVLMGCWQVAFLALGLLVGDYLQESEGLVRVSAVAGALAMLATLPMLLHLRRWADSSVVFAALMIPAGAAGA